MSTVFVAPVLPKAQEFAVVRSSIGARHACVPFKDGSALVAWTGHDITPLLLEEIPTADMLLGTNHDRVISLFAGMLRDVLNGHEFLYQMPGGDTVLRTEVVIATTEGVWRIDHACRTHRGAYACIGYGGRPAEAIFSELNGGASTYSKMVHALYCARWFDSRTRGPYHCSIMTLLAVRERVTVP